MNKTISATAFRATLCALALFCAPRLPAAFSQAATPAPTPAPYERSEFPEAVHSLRRFEIVAFGSFPLSLFYASIGNDCYRWYSNGWNMTYAPWPLKNDNSVKPTSEEALRVVLISGCISIGIASLDWLFVRLKHDAAERRARRGELSLRSPPESPGLSPSGGDAPEASPPLSPSASPAGPSPIPSPVQSRMPEPSAAELPDAGSSHSPVLPFSPLPSPSPLPSSSPLPSPSPMATPSPSPSLPPRR